MKYGNPLNTNKQTNKQINSWNKINILGLFQHKCDSEKSYLLNYAQAETEKYLVQKK